MRPKPHFSFRRLLRKITLWLLLPLCVLALLRLVWGYHASRRLDAAIAQLHAYHIPTTPEDFPDPASIPPNQNAVNDLVVATRNLRRDMRLVDTSRLSDAGNWDILNRLSPAKLQELQTIVEAFQPRFSALDAAADKPAIWPRVLFRQNTSQLTEELQEAMLGISDIRKALNAAAYLSLQRGDTFESLKNISRLVTISHIARYRPQLFYTFLYGDFFTRLTVYFLEALEPHINLNDPDQIALTRKVLRQLTDPVIQRPLSQAYEGDIVENLVSNPAPFPWPLQPLKQEDLAATLEENIVRHQSLQAVNWPRGRQNRFINYDGRLSNLEAIVRPLYARQFSNLKPALKVHFLAQTSARAMSLLLAARLYAAQHGHLPQSAAELLPEFLDRIPLDPFTENQPLHYRLDPDGPTVWSVGNNGIDDGGREVLIREGYRDRGNSSDIIYGAQYRRALPK